MKGKTKTQKGITLIALIITIVVLLILAAVAINSIQNDGILGYAINAATTYNQSTSNEQSMLNEYMNYLNNSNKKEIEFSIVGTKYKALEGMTWREFTNSEYNPGNFIIESETYGYEAVFCNWTTYRRDSVSYTSYNNEGKADDYSNTKVKPDDVITLSRNYEAIQGESGLYGFDYDIWTD